MFPVAALCRVLQVSKSGYYAWLKRPASERATRDALLVPQIVASHERSDNTYGSPRILGDLQEAGERVGRKRVARLMREEGLRGVSRRRFVITTKRSEKEVAAPDLVDRDFRTDEPNKLWVADITYVPT
jgi:putative transposase